MDINYFEVHRWDFLALRRVKQQYNIVIIPYLSCISVTMQTNVTVIYIKDFLSCECSIILNAVTIMIFRPRVNQFCSPSYRNVNTVL